MEYNISTYKVINFLNIVSKQKIKTNKNQISQIIPLDEQTKNEFELKHDTKLPNTMIYLDSDSDFSNKFILAYAIANKIHIKKSQYNPGSTETKEILEHELTHVQQYSEHRDNESLDELEFEANQNETKYLRYGEEVHWVELTKGKYFQMTEIEYKKAINKIAYDFEQEIEKEYSCIKNDEEKLKFLIKLKEWSNSSTSKRFSSRLRGI